MIRLRKIEIVGFRGSLDRLPILFGPSAKSMAIYGDNAAGKSSITDAIEWFYFDKVDHLWRENCMAGSLRHVLLPDTDLATVELQFNDPALNCTKSISATLALSLSNKTKGFFEYTAKIREGRERLTLRTIDILNFILQRKADRRRELEKIIGYEALDTFREIIGSTLYKLEKTAEYITARSNTQDHQREIIKILRTSIFTEQELFEAGQRIASEAGVAAKIDSLESYAAAGDEMKAKIQNKEQAIRKTTLADCREKSDLLRQKATDAVSSVSKFSGAYTELIASEEQVRQIQLRGFLSEGMKAIEGRLVLSDTCPLCLQTSPWDQLKKELEIRIEKLSQSKKKYDAAVAQKGETLSTLAKAIRAAEDFGKAGRKLDLSAHLLQPAEQYASAVKELARSIAEEFESFRPISMQIEETASLIDSTRGAAEFLRDQEAALELSEAERNLLNAVQRLENLIAHFQKFQNTSRTVRKFEEQIQALSMIRDDFSQLHTEALQNALDLMSEDISRYYLAMHPKEEVDAIGLSVVEEGVEFEYEFHGKRVYPPPKYLSESHLNSLGIAAFLASARIFNKINNFLILDDIVTSFDSNHRLRLLHLLKSDFSDWQIILLTHEPFLFEMIKKEMAPQAWLISELEALPGSPVQIKSSTRNLKEQIIRKKADGTLTPNGLRTGVERILKEIGYSLEVKMVYRYNDENERRMPGELLSDLRAALRKKSPEVLADPAFSKLEVCSLVATTGSHDSGPVLSPGDIETCFEDVFKFDELFCCKDCGTYVSVEKFVDHEKRVYCKCGKKHLQWKD